MKQQTIMNYNLYALRHELINQDMPTPAETAGLVMLNAWYDGLASEVTTVNNLIKIGVLTNE